jgi:hypothetical protein
MPEREVAATRTSEWTCALPQRVTATRQIAEFRGGLRCLGGGLGARAGAGRRWCAGDGEDGTAGGVTFSLYIMCIIGARESPRGMSGGAAQCAGPAGLGS